MKYPKFIQKGDIIAVTAPSQGFTKKEQILEYENAIKNIKNMGFKFIETKNVRSNKKGRSSSASQRAKQFMQLWKNDDVKAIICAKGGDFAPEMLDYLNFDILKQLQPKWIQGFSDNTNLGFVFTTNLDIATVYGQNIRDYGMNKLHKTLTDSIELMKGKSVIQKSYGVYQPNNYERNPFESYNLCQKINWSSLNNEEKIHFFGRAIGGCFDVIVNLIGTKYDKIKEYIQKYKEDGIVWFFDIFEMSTPQVFCRLWQMKNSGYFENCSGIIFGRPAYIREDYGLNLAENIKNAIGKLNVPILLDCDIGHIAPQMPIINGAIIDVSYEKGKGMIKTFFK